LELEKGNDRTRTAIDRLSLLSHYDASRIRYPYHAGRHDKRRRRRRDGNDKNIKTPGRRSTHHFPAATFKLPTAGDEASTLRIHRYTEILR
jgi:hypothetical protein